MHIQILCLSDIDLGALIKLVEAHKYRGTYKQCARSRAETVIPIICWERLFVMLFVHQHHNTALNIFCLPVLGDTLREQYRTSFHIAVFHIRTLAIFAVAKYCLATP